MKASFKQRGDIAPFLTIVSMVVLSVGLLVGYQLNSASRPINTAPFAQILPEIPDEGVDYHDEVCYPGGDKDRQVHDKYCRTRMFPASITRDFIKTADRLPRQIFGQLFQGTTQQVSNPLITTTTAKDQRTINT